ncbi:MAG: hypothetical protein AAGJ81_02685 [Verrucomicrobiota bacterium]
MRIVFRTLWLPAVVVLSSANWVAGQSSASAPASSSSDPLEVSESYEEAIEKYGNNPVEATRVDGPNQFSSITLLDLNSLGLEILDPSIGSSITLPEDNLNFIVRYSPELDTALYSRLRDEGQIDEALELLRKEIYPLLKYVPLDPTEVQIHRSVSQLISELLAAEKVAEVASILETFPKDRLTTLFRDQTVEVAAALIEDGDYNRAYDIVKLFPLGPGEVVFVPVYLNLANEFRLREDWERSRNLYKDVQLASTIEAHPEAFLWEGYIHLKEDRAFMVDAILDQFDSISTESPYYSLLELVKGSLLENQEKSREALSAFAKGLVYSTTNDPWTPELLFRTGELYEAEDFQSAAREVRYQLKFFYPESVWAERLPDS